MKQVLQSLRTGKTEVAEIPCPTVRRGDLLIRTSRTLVSAGTERMLVEFGKAGWISKARQQPDKVRMVLDKVATDGLVPTVDSVFNKLDRPLPLGYCNVGTVIDVGADVTGFSIGDRVVSNGNHAEVVSVPKNLCAKVPANVTDDDAAFAVIGAIGLQGIRLAQPTLGETAVVTGLGLIGLVTIQLLRAHGCRVLGIDFDAQKLELARRFGAEVVDLGTGTDPVAAANTFSRGRGVDMVLITAATGSNEPVHQAAQMSRKRGRIVLVGVAGLQLSRADFYEKELSFQVSCSYGPGRYDPNYEERGFDYPPGFVRWTEQRNFEAVLDMLAEQRIDVSSLVTHRIPIVDAERAYELVSDAKPLGIILQYPATSDDAEISVRRTTIAIHHSPPAGTKTGGSSSPTVAFVGAGNYSTAVLIPAFKAAGAHLQSVASRGGLSGFHAARKFGFDETTTDVDSVFDTHRADALVITTRHDSHARLAARGLDAGRSVFVEKPLALSLSELDDVETAWNRSRAKGNSTMLMVGFNRRFAPHTKKIKTLLESVSTPKVFLMTVNAGAIPTQHWTQDRTVGGGRIVGECCHFIDLLRFLAASRIVGSEATSIDVVSGDEPVDDKSTITLRFADGSIGTIHYLANGHKSFPKERLEVFAGGRVLQLDNFRKLRGFGWPGFKKMNLWRQDKGQRACAVAFVEALRSGAPSPIPLEEILEVSRVTIQVADCLRA